MPKLPKHLHTDPTTLKRRTALSVDGAKADGAVDDVNAPTLRPSFDDGAGDVAKALGKQDAPTSKASNGGATNAAHGIGMFAGLRRKMTRGVLVALTGIMLAGGANAQAPKLAPTLPTPRVSISADVRPSRTVVIDESSAGGAGGTPPPPKHEVTAAHRVTLPARKVIEGRDAVVKLVDALGQLRDVSTPHDDLPSLLWNDGKIKVEHGTDPGDYYCEHALFTQQTYASEVGILKNAHGEPLTGFLHVPDDAQSSLDADAPIDVAQRYAQHREVIGAAFAGYFDAAKAQVRHGPVKILITGYGPFMSIKNNPSGGFVSSQENIDAAMRAGFGDRLLTQTGEVLSDRKGGEADSTMTLRYRIRDGLKVRDTIIVAERLDVADSEFDQGDPHSLIGAMRAVKPHAMLSLGVHGGSQFLVEHHADDGGLVIDASGKMHHDGAKQPSVAFLDNYALARAVNSHAPPAPPVIALKPEIAGDDPGV